MKTAPMAAFALTLVPISHVGGNDGSRFANILQTIDPQESWRFHKE
jgi:hypothetical protein